MVQPRKEQVKNLKTRHARFDFEPNAGSAYTDIPAATLHSYVISDVAGGVQVDVRATALSSSEPFAPLALDEFKIDVGLGLVNVILAVTDKTVSRIAAKINTATANTVAYNEEGQLRIVSIDSGNDQELILEDVVPGALGRIGLIPGTYYGKSAPTRGVITESQEAVAPSIAPNIGGFIPLRTKDGKDIVTDADYIGRVAENGGYTYRRVGVSGGMPVHARLTYNQGASTYRLSYFAQMQTEPEVITFNSRFDLLDGTDAIDLTFVIPYDDGASVATQSIVISLPAGTFTGSTTRDQVVALLNAQFGAQANAVTGNGAAAVIGTITQPYSMAFGGSESITIAVDGGPSNLVSMSWLGAMTAQDVANKINALAIGATGTAVSVSGNIVVKIASNSTDGLISSIDIRNVIPGTLEKLGITPGVYRGSFIAEPYGVEEIRIRGLARGHTAQIIVSNPGPSTLARLGISLGSFRGGDNGEQKVNFPALDLDITNNPPVLALIPEVLEYGEVNLAVESVVEEFNAKALANRGGRSSDVTRDSDAFKYARTALTRGIEDAGKPVYTNMYGQIDKNLLRSGTEDLWSMIKKFVEGYYQYGQFNFFSLVTYQIKTPGTNGNPGAPSDFMLFQVDPDNSIGYGNREYDFYFGPGLPIRFTEDTPITNWDQEIQLSGDQGIRWVSRSASFSDPNVRLSGLLSGGYEYLDLSDTVHRYTRRLEYETNADVTPETLLQKANAIWTVTVGDGVGSFGDFNGNGAIQQAIDYFSTNITDVDASMGLRIQCKSGTYRVNVTNGPITIPNGIFCIIEGVTGSKHGFQPQVQITSDQPEIINFAGPAPSGLRLNNLEINTGSVATSTVLNVADQRIEASDCTFKFTKIRFIDASMCLFENCSFQGAGFAAIHPLIQLEAGDGTAYHGPFKFVDCDFQGCDENPIMLVKATGASISRTIINKIEFIECRIRLASTYNDGSGNLTGNCGVLEFDPNGSSWWRNYPNEGLEIREVSWINCDVQANVWSDDNSILIHCIPVANATELTASLDEQYLYLQRAVIRGGRWTCPAGVNSYFTPFVLAAAIVEISDLYTGWEDPDGPFVATRYGNPTDNIGFWLTNVFGAPAPPTADFGAYFIFAQGLSLDGITFVGLTQRSGSGDLFLRYSELFMNNISMTSYLSGGISTEPTQRIRFRSFLPTSGWGRARVSNLSIGVPNQLTEAAAGTDWATDAAIYYEPSAYEITFDGIRVGPWNIASPGPETAMAGILIPNCAPGDFYTGSPTYTQNFTLTNSTIFGCNHGFHFDGSGDGQKIVSCIISNNKINFNWGYGVFFDTINDHLSPEGGFTGVVISGNTIFANFLYGVFLRAYKWEYDGTYTYGCDFSLTGNTIGVNALTHSLVAQVVVDVIPDSTYAQQVPVGVIIGNNCTWEGNSPPGYIYVNASSGGGRVIWVTTGERLLAGGAPTNPRVHGIWRGPNYGGTDNYYNYQTGQLMALNIALLGLVTTAP